MTSDRVLIVGLDRPETDDLRRRIAIPSLVWPVLPRIRIDRGTLLAERPDAAGAFLPVSRVVFHGIFGDDFDFLTALALWNGPCLPGALGMMNCRLRLPSLARALRVSRFSALPRGFAGAGHEFTADAGTVAKWGNWHCGDNKERLTGPWTAPEATVLEDFVVGRAVRIMIVGDRHWQIRLSGDTWKKSIHADDAAFEPADPDLLADTQALGRHFGLECLGVDYMIADTGERHLLEVNHIPNVTRFPEIRAAFLDMAADWINRASK